jgi:hypothetical protein
MAAAATIYGDYLAIPASEVSVEMLSTVFAERDILGLRGALYKVRFSMLLLEVVQPMKCMNHLLPALCT